MNLDFLRVTIPFWGDVVINKGTNIVLNYPILINGSAIGIHELILSLRPDAKLELCTKFNTKELLPQEDSPQAPPTLTEQLSKLPFKEQNALYKLLNTWGCRMER